MTATATRTNIELEADHVHEPQLEYAVLGCLLLAPKAFERVAWLRSDDFFGNTGIVFESMRRLWGVDHWFDVPLIRLDLKNHSQWGNFVDGMLLQQCLESVGSPALLESYARELRQKARVRKLIGLSSRILNLAHSRTTADEIASEVRRQLNDVMQSAQSSAASADVVVIEALDQINKLAEQDDRSGVIATGIADFDRLCGGLYPGEMIVLAARPGVGKTSFALQVAMHTALRQRPVYIASLEMRRAELMVRALATRSKISGSAIRQGLRDKDKFRDLHEAARRVSEEAALWIDDRPRMTVDDIRGECHRLANADGLSLIVVDYLARLQPTNRKAQRYEQIGELTRDLKCLACELRVPLLLLAQLNREADGAVPSMRHLRESGDIEADADVICLLYPDTETTVKFRIEKNRNGKCAELELQWNADLTEFWCLSNHDWAEEPQPRQTKHLPPMKAF